MVDIATACALDVTSFGDSLGATTADVFDAVTTKGLIALTCGLAAECLEVILSMMA